MRYIILVFIVVLGVNTDSVPLRTYELKKDINPFVKKGFSVYNNSKSLIYRIEGKSLSKAKAEYDLVAMPSKRVVGTSIREKKLINLNFFNEQTNKWLGANIAETFGF